MLTMLDQDGILASDATDVDDEFLLDLFGTMLRTRLTDEKLLNLQRQGRLGGYYQVSGQEAHVGAAMALRPHDWIFTAYRELGIWLARGISTDAVMATWMGVPDDAELWDVDRFRVTRVNATIGTHLPHAVGFARAQSISNVDDLVAMVVFGDGATSESDFHAAMNFAGVWKAPVIFLCQNNQVAQSTTFDRQTASATVAQKAEAYGFPGVLVDGMDPLAVHAAVVAARARAAAGDGPTLVEMLTYRFAAHSTYDGAPAYRTREEEQLWRSRDPLLRLGTLMQRRGLWSDADTSGLKAEIAADLDASIDRMESRGGVGIDFSARHLMDRIPARVARQIHEADADAGRPLTELATSDLYTPGTEPTPAGERRLLDLGGAINAALHEGFASDPSLVLLGEDVALEGGVFRITDGMLGDFGSDRIMDTPLCETGIVGTAVGMAMAGLRPVCEIEFAGFVYPAFDQVIGHVARIRWRYRGRLTAPIVVRMPVGTGISGYEFHTDTPESFFAHAPGLVLVYPSTPYDAKGLMATALRSPDPVMFLEPIASYRAVREDVPAEHYEIPFGRARIRRPGTDVTVISYGPVVATAVAAADALAADGIDAEVIDLRTLTPWDEDLVFESVRRTGRAVIASEANLSCSLASEIATRIGEAAAYELEAPVVRVGHPDLFWGPTQLETHSTITTARVAGAIVRAMNG